MDSQWASPAWPGLKVLVQVGEIPPANAAQVAPLLPDATSDWRLFHLTRPFPPLALLQLVIDRLDRHRQFTADAILMSPAGLDSQTCAAALDRVSADPWLLDLATTPETGHLEHLLIGAGYTTHPLFVQFFRALQDAQGQPLMQVLDVMGHYLRPPAPPSPPAAATPDAAARPDRGKTRAGMAPSRKHRKAASR